MKVFIARHGEASFNAPSDHERPLTPNGISTTKKLVAQHLEALKEIDMIWCSHLTRAIHTAEIYADALAISPAKKPFLSPDGEPEKVIRALEKDGQDQTILIVSHQPLVGDLVSLLCNGNVYEAHPYATSEVVVLEMDHPGVGLANKVANYLPA